MNVFNNKSLTIAKYICNICFIISSILTSQAEATGAPITINTTLIFSSCITQESVPKLPKLSFAKAFGSYSGPITCNADCVVVAKGSDTAYLTWYSYSSSENCCTTSTCHEIQVSTLSITSAVLANEESGFIYTSSGVISNGPFAGQEYVQKLVNPLSNQQACASSSTGLEISAGSATFAITDGPICTGIYFEQYCPGVRFG